MKNTFLSLSVLVLFSFSSCTKDDNSSSAKNDVVNTVASGTWKISLFSEDGIVETSNFTGYNFTFASGGVLTANNGTNTYTGTWNVMNSNSNDDSVDDLEFNIFFASPSDFEDLSEDWDILSRTSTKIDLRHISGGDGGTDLLTFEKN